MTTYALNSGVINATPFPGAESGVSYVELLGVAEVECVNTALFLRLQATASTAAAAIAGNVTTTNKSLLGAVTTGSATATVDSVKKIKLDVAASATATTTGTAILKRQIAGSTVAVAVAPNLYSYNATKKAAAISAVATVNAPSPLIKVPLAGATQGTATVSAVALRKIPFVPTTVGTATSSASFTLRERIGASTTPTASTTALTTLRRTVGASTIGTATGSALPYRKLLMANSALSCVAVCGDVAANQLLSFAANTQANASDRVTMTLKYPTAAYALARAIANSAAVDYGTAMPAPDDRLMRVQVYDRRMKVTT